MNYRQPAKPPESGSRRLPYRKSIEPEPMRATYSCDTCHLHLSENTAQALDLKPASSRLRQCTVPCLASSRPLFTIYPIPSRLCKTILADSSCRYTPRNRVGWGDAPDPGPDPGVPACSR